MIFLVLHGPNLNLLGTRDPARYGSLTLEEINERLRQAAAGHEVECHQSNHEGALIDLLHGGRGRVAGALLNAGAFTHTSYALRDAIEACEYPVVEVHLSNVYARERFRRRSVLSPVCAGVVAGFREHSYLAALHALIAIT